MSSYAPFAKYHALGNDYAVMRDEYLPVPVTAETVRSICHRNFGIGSDGLLIVGNEQSDGFPVRVFNPDGSEAENSGNGMRIAARFIHDNSLARSSEFTLLAGGTRKLRATISDAGKFIQVEIGPASFLAKEIPVAGPQREVLDEEIEIAGEKLRYSCVSVGNPHCVVLGRHDLKASALQLGPLLENHVRFPNRLNVQIARVLDRQNVLIEIWERGAGYTLASGTSSSAVAAVCHKLGLVDEEVSVHMPGGTLRITIDSPFTISLAGPVTKVAQGELDTELVSWKIPSSIHC